MNNGSRMQEYGSEVDSHDEDFNDALNEAIIQSIFEQEQNEEEEKMLREVMKLSVFEHQKQNGQLSLDHLKKRNTQVENNQQLKNQIGLNQQFQKINPNDLPPVEIGGKKNKNLIQPSINADLSMQLVNNSDLQSSQKYDPQNMRDSLKLKQVPFDKKAEEDIQRQKQAKDLEEKKLMDMLTPINKEESPKNAESSAQKQKEEFQDLLNSAPRKDKNSNKKWREEEEKKEQEFEDLLDESLQVKEQKIDKDKLKEIMKKKNKDQNIKEDNSDLHKGNPNSIFYEDPAKKSKSNAQEVESEDEFDKLIGHIEGSRADIKQEDKAEKKDDVEEEDFF